jgi:hypothetical protein
MEERMDNQGWIKLHRSIIDWEWFDDANTLSLWIHLLLKANYKDSTWHGVEVKRGSMIAGRIELSKMTGISEQSIRTSLSKLKSTNNITIKSTNKYSVISINNYDKYQDTNQPDNQQLTSNQPATNHVLRSKEVKKERNNIYKHLPEKDEVTGEQLEQIAKQYSVSVPNVKDTWDSVFGYCHPKGEKYANFYATTQNWVRRAIKDKKILVIKQEDDYVRRLNEVSR